jgi:hypothetical protein
MDAEQKKQLEAAQAQIKQIYDDKVATINGRDYVFTLTNHNQRVKVFAFMSKIQSSMQIGDFSFLTTKEWEDVYKILSNIITFDGQLLSKLPDHWETYEEDFLQFVAVSMTVVTYPFSRGKSIA